MEVQIKEIESISILYISGEITLYDVDLIVKSVDKMRENGNNMILVNMEGVPFMDSSGIGIFLQIIVSLQKEQGFLFFINCAKRIKSLLSLSIGTTSAKIFETEEEAIAEINKIKANM